jgi:general secretion pathway protein A
MKMDYLEFFHLADDPFRLPPDPSYFYPSEIHHDILESLNFAVEQKEGFILVTGGPGTGKSTLLKVFIEQWKERAAIALIMTPRLSPQEFLLAVLDDLNVEHAGDNKNEIIKAFRDFLVAQSVIGQRVVIIVDEAQLLPDETLEELRLLSNLETEKEKLLQIILTGQPELKRRLSLDALSQLDQRITVRGALRPLTREETFDYISYRSTKAGKGTIVFEKRARDLIFGYSKGIPRLINIVASRALMAAFLERSTAIRKNHVSCAIEHLSGAAAVTAAWKKPLSFAALAVLLASAAFFFMVTDKIGPLLNDKTGNQSSSQRGNSVPPADSNPLRTDPSETGQRPPDPNSEAARNVGETAATPQNSGAKNKITRNSIESPVFKTGGSRAVAVRSKRLPADKARIATVIADTAALYDGTSQNSVLLMRAAKGNVLDVIENGPEINGTLWYKVKTESGREGWVADQEVWISELK